MQQFVTHSASEFIHYLRQYDSMGTCQYVDKRMERHMKQETMRIVGTIKEINPMKNI